MWSTLAVADTWHHHPSHAGFHTPHTFLHFLRTMKRLISPTNSLPIDSPSMEPATEDLMLQWCPLLSAFYSSTIPRRAPPLSIKCTPSIGLSTAQCFPPPADAINGASTIETKLYGFATLIHRCNRSTVLFHPKSLSFTFHNKFSPSPCPLGINPYRCHQLA
jgi:hypothetical protein